jgi:Fe-S-cluster containining protein
MATIEQMLAAMPELREKLAGKTDIASFLSILPEIIEQGIVIHTSEDKLRSCGNCHACCVMPGVNVLNKPPRHACHNLDGDGKCSIYAKRPDPCVVFQCGWRLGNFSEEYRPNKIGVLVTLASRENRLAATILIDRKTLNQDAAKDIIETLIKANVYFTVIDEANNMSLYKDGKTLEGFVVQKDHEEVEMYITESR